MDYHTGMQNALEEGKAQGLAEGKAEGEIKGKAEIARNLKAEGFDTEKISKLTGLSLEEIEKI